MDNQSIGGRLRLAMGEIGENELARMSGVPQSTIHRILTGDSREPRLSNLEKIARALGVSVLWLQTGIPEEPAAQSVKAAIPFDLFPVEEWADDTPLDDDAVELPLYKSVELSSGNGRFTSNAIDHGSRLRFGRRTLAKARVDKACAAGALNKGRSNEPVFPDGSIVMIDTSKTEIIDGEPYALDHMGELRIKCLYRLPGGGLRLRSYNREEYPDEDYGPDWHQSIRVIGWAWTHLPPIRVWPGR